jgi:hypothetical protein
MKISQFHPASSEQGDWHGSDDKKSYFRRKETGGFLGARRDRDGSRAGKCPVRLSRLAAERGNFNHLLPKKLSGEYSPGQP